MLGFPYSGPTMIRLKMILRVYSGVGKEKKSEFIPIFVPNTYLSENIKPLLREYKIIISRGDLSSKFMLR